MLVLGGLAAGLLLLVFTLLFGQNPKCSRTPLPRLHRLLLSAGQLCSAAARRACGRRGPACLHAASELCCQRSNPTVQLLFVGLLGGCYWIFWSSIFPVQQHPCRRLFSR